MNPYYALIVEDDPKLGVIFKTALEQAGYDVDLDENGNKYQELLTAREPQLALVDLHVPYAFGGDILDAIRAKYPFTVIAIVTADFIKAKTLTGKADHIMIKPIGIASLLKLAESVKGAL